ncbi:MAG: polyprenyl diphosphate synthase [Pseudomonadota bacterium]
MSSVPSKPLERSQPILAMSQPDPLSPPEDDLDADARPDSWPDRGPDSAPDPRGDPRHVAIIMDGNGRWAQKRHLPRLEGHRRGVETARRIVEAAYKRELGFLTLYSFSTENWRRPKAEVTGLMQLFRHYVESNLEELHRNNVRIRMIGWRDRVEPDIVRWVERAEDLTAKNTGMTLSIAFNYGSRQEIVEAGERIIEQAKAGLLDPHTISTETIKAHMLSTGLPDPDLLIRTSGEQRMSNYLLWQIVNAEIYITETLWPDFDAAGLELALDYFRQRRAPVR